MTRVTSPTVYERERWPLGSTTPHGHPELIVGGGSGAPSTATYLTTTSQAGLTNEVVVGTTPGGELGGSWSSPTVDAVHSGSSHADLITFHEATAIHTQAKIAADLFLCERYG